MPQQEAPHIGLRTHPHDAAVALRAYARGQTTRPQGRPAEAGRSGLNGCRKRGACPGCRAHTGSMGRMIWTILGVILAVWLAFTAIGWITATLKTFLITALIAAIVIAVVSLVAKLPGRD
jgi:hypothetical protein